MKRDGLVPSSLRGRPATLRAFILSQLYYASYEGPAMKTVLILMLSGALVGAAAASFIVPPMLSWYTSPGGLPQGAQIQAVVQIPEVIRYATSKLLVGQAVGGGVGALTGLSLGLMFRRKPRPSNPSSSQ